MVRRSFEDLSGGKCLSCWRLLGLLAGCLVLAIWLPVLFGGLRSLRTRGRLGRSDTLIVTGVYSYVRHPLYAGLAFTLTGLGLVIGALPIVLAGLGWLIVTQLWSVREERELERRFGPEFTAYRQMTPRIVPDVRRFLRDRGNTEAPA